MVEEICKVSIRTNDGKGMEELKDLLNNGFEILSQFLREENDIRYESILYVLKKETNNI